MNNNAWFKKENPLLSLQSMSGGAAGSLMQGVATKPYIEDVFSNYVYTGNSATRSIDTGIAMTKGGLTWIKDRSDGYHHVLQDTERGAGAATKIASNLNDAENAGDNGNQWSGYVSSFNSDGFSLDKTGSGAIDWANVNKSGTEYASWNFRKHKGFFDVVTWTGNGSVRTISHSLGCIPGLIIVKGYSNTNSWYVYHRDVGPEKYLRLNATDAETDQSWFMNDTAPTASAFSLGTSSNVNGSGQSYVAYVFPGGTADATDKAVSFDGTDDKLTFAATSDFTFGTGAYTVEYWIYYDNLSSGDIIFSQYTNANGGFVITSTTGKVAINQFGVGDVLAYNTAPTAGVWTHYAFVRESTSTNKTYIFVNGELKQTGTDSTDWSTTQISAIGGNAHPSSTQYTDCKISNFRITKGQAVYTANFNVPHDPLTTTSQNAQASNVKVICCNGDTTTASTVTPGTITAVGSPSMSTDNSIFDDTSSNVFGDDEDKGVIKTGKYVGNGSATGPEIFLGWEPQWVLIKNTDLAYENWFILDNIRGIVTNETEAALYTNSSVAEAAINLIDLTSTGFKTQTADDKVNGDGHSYIYMAIRRPDGYVGKPAEAGTDVFFQNYIADADDPSLRTSTFAGDFALWKPNQISNEWGAGSRLTQGKRLETNTNAAETSNSNWQWDFMNGFFIYNNPSVQQMGWMWKRHAGFDVVTWAGTNSSVVRRHNLGRTPEMIWYKNRDDTRNWKVYHKGLNGGTNPEDYTINLNSDTAEASNTSYMTGTAPTSTTFVAGNDGDTNGFGDNYIAMLFASVDSISKVGSYSGANSEQTITLGFQPRFIIIRNTAGSRNWVVFDTVRGWAAGNDQELNLNKTDAQGGSKDIGAPIATGFTLAYIGNDDTNSSGHTYLYYAHA